MTHHSNPVSAQPLLIASHTWFWQPAQKSASTQIFCGFTDVCLMQESVWGTDLIHKVRLPVQPQNAHIVAAWFLILEGVVVPYLFSVLQWYCKVGNKSQNID